MGALQKYFFPLLIIHNLEFQISKAAREITFHTKEEQTGRLFIGSLIEQLFFPVPVEFMLLDNSEYFHLEYETGNLYTTEKRLDREAICPFEVSDNCAIEMDAFASSDEHSEIIKVNVYIEDINDNPPHFAEDVITLYVPENAPMGTKIPIDHTATDADAGTNSELIYHLNCPDDVFGLSQFDGIISLTVLKPLDRELQSVYKMTIEAFDRGSPTLFGSVVTVVQIMDVNDNCPVFLTNNVSVSLLRNSTVNSTVLHIVASDGDIGENGLIHYMYSNRIQEHSKNLFRLDGTSGIISLSAPLNDRNFIHKLTVLAIGPGCVPAVAVVTVTIQDVRRREPRMELRFIGTQAGMGVSIREDIPQNTIIAILEITDPDDSMVRPLYINGTSHFILKPSENSPDTYLILTSKDLDFETEQKYNIQILGNSTFEESAVFEKILSITVEDVNDNAPRFPQDVSRIDIYENNKPGETLIRVSASDADSGPNGNIRYILEDAATDKFAIDSSSGVLTASVSFDREKETSYSFLVTGLDQGSPSNNNSCRVIVQILDKNDNPPRFSNNNFNFFIPEDLPQHGEVGIINVTDADLGSNGDFDLSLVNFSDLLSIDQDRILRSKGSFDYETRTLYELWIEAKDKGNPPLLSRAKIYVHILDVNDNAPLILSPESNFSYVLVPPDVSKGSCITNVHAVDYDAGMNGVITYSEYGEMDPTTSLFKVDPYTGNVTLKETADTNPCGLYQLLVKASDHGYPVSLSTIVRVNILLNHSISNESYLESLIMAKPTMSKMNPVIKIIPCPQYTALPFLSWTLISPVGLVILILSCLCCLFCCVRKRDVKGEQRSEVQIPLKLNAEYCVKEWNEMELEHF